MRYRCFEPNPIEIMLNTLRDLYIEQLKDLYSAEKQLTEALPKMQRAASSQELKDGFAAHLEQTRNHIERLRKIADRAGFSLEGEHCEAMAGLVREGEELMNKLADPTVKDAGLIASAQRIEHYEIAGYGTARTMAKQLDEREAADLLQTTLNEEADTDEKLTKIATGGMFSSGVNQAAAHRR